MNRRLAESLLSFEMVLNVTHCYLFHYSRLAEFFEDVVDLEPLRFYFEIVHERSRATLDEPYGVIDRSTTGHGAVLKSNSDRTNQAVR